MKGAAFYVILTAALLAESDAAPAQDSAAGKAVFGKCQACHAVGTGAKNKLGPELNGFAWDQASFAAFMQDPKTKVPGNKMAFAGMKDQAEIASLWTYLARFNADGSSK